MLDLENQLFLARPYLDDCAREGYGYILVLMDYESGDAKSLTNLPGEHYRDILGQLATRPAQKTPLAPTPEKPDCA